MQSSNARPTMGRGRQTTAQAGPSTTSRSGTSIAQLPPTHSASGEPIPLGEQLMQVDQAITLALQEIDANFAQTHQTITARILPAIKRYGMASHNTWQGARFWHHFFETASDIRLAPTRGADEWTEQGDESAAAGRDNGEAEAADVSVHDADSSLAQDSSPQPPRVSDASLAATARLGRAKPDGLQRENLAVGIDMPEASGSTPRTARHSALAKDVLKNQHTASIGKLQATPRRGADAKNPFAANNGKVQAQPRLGWNGIADLRKTPLASSKQKGKSGAGQSEVGDDSLPWPPGMSPPVTMQFSVPRSRYTKTPAKEAAKMVVDDLLRTVEGTSSINRKRMMQEREARRSASGAGPSGAGKASAAAAIPSGLVGTPLRKTGARKGRTSMPTPPTVTKRVPADIPSHLGPASNAPVPGSATSSARLLDEGEQGDESMDLETVPSSLQAGLNNLAISRDSSSLDVMFDSSRPDDEDSDNDDLDSDSDDEALNDVRHGSSSSAMQAGYPSSATRHGSWPGGPGSGAAHTSASVSQSIDEDTLFGIRDPARSQNNNASKPQPQSRIPSGARPAFANARSSLAGRNGGARSAQQPAGASSHVPQQGRAVSVAKPGSSASRPAQARTPQSAGRKSAGTSRAPDTQASFQPRGQIAALGTVHRGRPLLGTDERRGVNRNAGADDITYSAPSPTPLGATARHSGGAARSGR